MNFISIDAVTQKSNISLFIDNQCVSEYNNCENSSHLPKVIKLSMEENNLDLKDLDYIAVTIGPGSYTGIRVGLSISQGIAYSLSIPIVPVHTMDYLHDKSIYLEDKNKIVGFPSYGDNLIYFSVNDAIKSKNKVADVKYFKDKKVFGAQLDKFGDIFEYEEISISSKLIGLYSIENYSRLATKEMNSVSPIYLDIYGVEIND